MKSPLTPLCQREEINVRPPLFPLDYSTQSRQFFCNDDYGQFGNVSAPAQVFHTVLSAFEIVTCWLIEFDG
jgi:hypothetical protein